MWQPISEEKLLNMIREAEVEFDAEPQAKIFWKYIKIKPTKWQQSPWGDAGGGFWVVALIGQECIYFNDIEEGFNVGRFSITGRIDDYQCSQSELTSCIYSYYSRLMHDLKYWWF